MARIPKCLGFPNRLVGFPRLIETRSLPTLTRSYPRRYTFYVAHPARSIRSSQPPAVKFAPCEPLPLVALAPFAIRYGSFQRFSFQRSAFSEGCVRFKSLEDLALDVRFAGRERYGGRPRAVASWSRAAGATVLVKPVGRAVARVSAEEHMANYRAARALLGKGRNAGEGAAGF
jgi:hypothetical protein